MKILDLSKNFAEYGITKKRDIDIYENLLNLKLSKNVKIEVIDISQNIKFNKNQINEEENVYRTFMSDLQKSIKIIY